MLTPSIIARGTPSPGYIRPIDPRKPSVAQPLERQVCAYIQHQHSSTKRPSTTMSFLAPGLTFRRTLLLSTPLILSAPLVTQQFGFRQRVRCDGPDPLQKITSDLTRNYASEAQTPVILESGAPNPRAIRQISMGSILGVLGGMGVSLFSKPLALLIGLGIFVVQVCSLFIATTCLFSS
jgi:hypothetical protein